MDRQGQRHPGKERPRQKGAGPVNRRYQMNESEH
jgi:hypothetical protein